MSSITPVTSVYYPESDGKPMAETDIHRIELVRQIDLLERFFARQQVYVSGNLLLYYERGNVEKSVAPDVFVVKGLAPGLRRVYKLWVEGKTPNVIIEVTSRKTKKKDTDTKPPLYARLGVREFFLFDPTQDYLVPPLLGYRLAGDEYEPLVADAEGGLVSDELGLRLQHERRHLMFYRLDTGERLLTAEEARRAEAKARRAAEQRCQAAEDARRAEAEARQAAEVEVARLREELRRRPS
jgi:Uma2 family endonuclease